MKIRNLLLVTILSFATSAFGGYLEPYQSLLDKYVEGDAVDYAAWKMNPSDLQKLESVVNEIAEEGSLPKGKDEALAYYLNAYNAWILHLMLERYPVNGPLSGNPAFFHLKKIRVNGEKMSFDRLEQKIIRPTFDEPRIHFALNCASESCPPLSEKAFRVKGLDEHLDRLTDDFINSKAGVQLEGNTLRVSKVFDWYEEDFEKAGGVAPYIQRYYDGKMPPRVKVEPMDYSWKLNDTK